MKLDKPVDNAIATVIDFGFGESPEKQTPYIYYDFQLDDFESDSGEKLEIRAYNYLSEKSFEHTLKTLSIVFEWKGDNIFELDKDSAGDKFYNLVGKKARITVEIDTYEGKKTAKVKWINAVNQKPKQLPREAIKALSDKLKDKVSIYRAKEKDTLPF